MRTWLGVVIAVAACKGKAEQKAAPAVAGSAVVVVAPPADAAAPAKKQLSKGQLADYKKHMKAGWALQKQQQWAESVPEFEAAAKAVDGDQRALAELGWSAMNAGDFKKARRADDQAVRVAIDPKVKASALFNLGMVEAKTGNVDDARESFTESLKLRPNQTVEGELAKLGAAPATPKPFCPEGKDPCRCVLDDAYPDMFGDEADMPKCEIATNATVSTWKNYAVNASVWSHTYVLDEHNNFLFELARGDDRARHSEDMAVDKAEVKTVGGHKVVWIQQHDNYAETIPSDNDDTDETVDNRTVVTLCVLGDDKRPTTCPMVEVLIQRDYEGEGSAHSATKADIALGGDGTATVKLVSGPSCCGLDAFMGPQKLW
ncbi:MAG: tetratricopeptide repeat protein [Deltaproteobacteria bacterium]|nr:tetratricopeptide repeat protein [Deltaproteobacteria bacterium]